MSQTCHTCSHTRALVPTLLLVEQSSLDITWLVPSPASGLCSNVDFSVRLSLTILLRRTQPFWSPFPAFFFSIAHSVIWSILDILLIYFVYFFLQQECKLHQGRGFYVYCCNPRTSKSGWHGVGMQYVFIEQMNAYHYLKHGQVKRDYLVSKIKASPFNNHQLNIHLLRSLF